MFVEEIENPVLTDGRWLTADTGLPVFVAADHAEAMAGPRQLSAPEGPLSARHHECSSKIPCGDPGGGGEYWSAGGSAPVETPAKL